MNSKGKARLFAMYLLNMHDDDELLQQVVDTVMEMPDIRDDRINAIRMQLETGTYQINFDQLTEDLLTYLRYSTR